VPGFRNQILILEDDSTLGKALKQAFEKEGLVAYLTSRPEEARELIEKSSIGTLFVDCLLPSISGVEFAQQIRTQFSTSMVEIVLMSGVFTDSTFINDSIRLSQAKSFLKKPFDLKDALKLVEKPVSDADTSTVTIHPRKNLYSLFNKEKTTIRDRKKAIEALEEIHGFDLPFIYSVLVEAKASGHLNTATQAGQIYGISFSHGAIVAVDIPDKDTFLGKLLIERGFVQPDDLNIILKDKSATSGKKIGEKLIQANLLSPHALNIVMAHQMNLRLSRAIVDEKVRVNFVEADVEKTNPNIDSMSFNFFLHDWIASKITLEWLKAHFLQWSDCPIVEGPGYVSDHPVLGMQLVRNLENIFSEVTNGKTLSQILDSQKYPEEAFLKALHFLLTKNLIAFKEPIRDKSVIARAKFLKKIFNQFSGLSKVEIFKIMGKMTGGSETHPDLVLREFQKLIGAPPDPQEKEIASIYQQLLTLAQQGYDGIKSTGSAASAQDVATGVAVAKIKAAGLFEEAKNLLQRSQYKQAFDKLVQAMAIDRNLEKGRLFKAWAQLGALEVAGQREQKIKEIEIEMVQISPEDKMDALYYFVMGLLSKAKGDQIGARKHLEKAIAIDNTLIYARRELTMITNIAQKKDVLQADLRDLVGGFFKKR
jgi:CheY-like chemotaxis protein